MILKQSLMTLLPTMIPMVTDLLILKMKLMKNTWLNSILIVTITMMDLLMPVKYTNVLL